MSKKNKSVLSIMLALVILLAPLSALHAKAEEPTEQEYEFSYNADPVFYTIGADALLEDPNAVVSTSGFGVPADSITGVFVEGYEDKGGWSVRYTDTRAYIDFTASFFEGFGAGEYTLNVTLKDHDPVVTTMYIKESPFLTMITRV